MARRSWPIRSLFTGTGLTLAAALLASGATPVARPAARKATRPFPVVEKARRHSAAREASVRKAHAPSSVGTIQYDNDIPFSRDGNAIFVGNVFNAGVQDPHSIAAVSLRRGGAAGTTVLVGVFGVPIITLGYGSTGGLPATTAGTMVVAFNLQAPVVSHSGPFIAAALNDYNGGCAGNTMLGAPCDGPALSAGTMDPGMGFHAVRLYATGTSGVPIPSRNAIIRVTGDNLPVELMGLSFE
jgi:hypothetical protein